MKAMDIMTSQVITIPDTASIDYARTVLMEEAITALPVVDETNDLVGIITQTDFFNLANLFKDRLFDDEDFLREVTIRDVMTRKVVAMDEETGLFEISEAMVDNQVHRVVITRNNEVAGIVSIMDVLKNGIIEAHKTV